MSGVMRRSCTQTALRYQVDIWVSDERIESIRVTRERKRNNRVIDVRIRNNRVAYIQIGDIRVTDAGYHVGSGKFWCAMVYDHLQWFHDRYKLCPPPCSNAAVVAGGFSLDNLYIDVFLKVGIEKRFYEIDLFYLPIIYSC